MDQTTILGLNRYRSLFDSSSDEFKKSNYQEKLTILSSLEFWGLLDQTIQDFKEKYDEPKDKYILQSLSPTISRYLSFIKFGNPLHFSEFDQKGFKSNYEDLKHEISKFADANFSFTRLLESYVMGDENVFKKENAFFKIDFNKDDFEDKLKARDLIENTTYEESYFHLYKFLHQNLIPDFRKNHFHGYQIDMGMSYPVEYLIKFYLQEPTKENYLKAILYAAKIIYLGKPPYHPFYLCRINFSDQGMVQDFYANHKIGIHLHTQKDHEDFEKLQKEEMPDQLYVRRWKHLLKTLRENDVLVLASYKNLGSKVGMIYQHSLPDKVGSIEDFHAYFSLKNVQDVDIESHPFIQSLLPSNVTISPIKRKNYLLRKDIFPQMIVQLPFHEFDDLAYEILAMEWLRSKHAPKDYRLTYQLLKVGGNLKDIDIYGMTENQEKLIAQVSVTNNPKLMEKKIKQLEKYVGFKKVFFFKTKGKVTTDYEIISLDKVILDLEKDPQYKDLVAQLR
jgi:hypothetical protein